MTRSSEVSPIKRYTCNGTTLAFPTVFQFFDEDELKVVFIPDDTDVAETTLTLTTNYTVSGGDGSTGTVTTTGDDPLGNDPYDDGDLVIIRETPLTQEIQSRTTGAFRPPNIENALDKINDQMSEREVLSEFALRLADTTDMSEADAELPPLEASKFIGVNASGLGFIFSTAITGTPVSTFGASLIDDLSSGSALQTLGLSTYIRTLMDDLTAASALETLSIGTFMRTLVDDTDAAAARATLAVAADFPGLVIRPQFEYIDKDSIYIGSGVHHHAGTTEQLLYWDTQLVHTFTSLGSAGWSYLYLDDSAIVTAGTNLVSASQLLDTNTQPVYSSEKHGWYNGLDKCIWAGLTDVGSSLLEFFHAGDKVTHANGILEYALVDIDLVWTTWNIASAVPKLATKATVRFERGTANADFYWRTTGQTGIVGHMVIKDSQVGETAEVITDASRTFQVVSGSDDTAKLGATVESWFFPIGM